MRINDDPVVTGAAIALAEIRPPAPEQSFADLLDAERLKAETEAQRSEILAGQDAPKEDANKDDMAFIRERGLRAYAEEIHKQKIEELREKLLEAMGLTEEDLANMPADQRMAIENAISREIQNRMAAKTITNGESGPEAALKNPSHDAAGLADAKPGGLLAAQIIAGQTGTLVGAVIVDAVDNPQPVALRKEDVEDR